MKKIKLRGILSITLALLFMVSTSSITFAKERNNQFKHNAKAKVKTHYSISLQKSLNTIAPKRTTCAAIDPVIAAQADTVKKAYTNYNTIAKQVSEKKATTKKLILQIRTSNKTLTSDQYTTLSALITAINTEAKSIVNVKGIHHVIQLVNARKHCNAIQVTSADLTAMLVSITANTTHLNTISATLDMINSTLTTIVNTTPAAVKIQ